MTLKLNVMAKVLQVWLFVHWYNICNIIGLVT